MAKKMLIDATHAEETRVVVVDGNKVEEFDFESENKRQLAGNIYLAKVTRVEPSLQAAFVDYGGNRHGFLAFSEIHPDYYQIPVADRQALMEEEAALAAEDDDENDKEKSRSRSSKSRSRRSRSRSKAETAGNDDKTASADVSEIKGMETIDLETEGAGDTPLDVVEDTIAAGAADAPVADPAPANDSDAGTETAPAAEAQPAARDVSDEGDDCDDDDGDSDPRDDSIESVADDDTEEEIRPRRKPRARKYKIQEVIKVRQIMLVQVVKEERGNKGAALTTYLSLAGRYCVLMPNTARGGGISRKITNAADRKKLKEIATEIDVPQGAGLIIRTAGAKRTKSEIKRDYEYLQRLWEQIRELTLQSIAPAKIYEEGDLIKRSIRDLYSRDIDEVLVEGERGYRIAKDFMKMIMPSHAKNVKNYSESMPLFARYQVESYLSSMFNPVVQLRSGGYIVIGVTEALVAIDVNSGRATKEGSIEETALKTNLEAAEEVARQLRLRDLAGLIVIDFIDMEERKNNAAVEKRLKDRLKTDRARIQVGRISGFGLLEMSRQRLRPGMIEATTQACPHCHGTGLIRSDDNLALSILRQIEEEGTRRRSREVLVKAPVSIANYLMNQKRDHVAQIEGRYGMAVRIEGDPMLISPDFSLEKFKTATRIVSEVVAPVVSVDASLMEDIDEDTVEEEAEEVREASEDEQKPKKRRRRRRSRRSKSSQRDDQENGAEAGAAEDQSAKAEPAQAAEAPDASEAVTEAPAEKVEEPAAKEEPKAAKPKSTRSTKAAKAEKDEAAAEEKPKPKTTRSRKKPEADDADKAEEKPKAAPAKKATTTRSRSTAKKTEAPAAEDAAADAPKKAAEKPAKAPKEAAAKAEPEPQPAQEPAMAEAAPQTGTDKPEEDASKPKRRGWWSLGR